MSISSLGRCGHSLRTCITLMCGTREAKREYFPRVGEDNERRGRDRERRCSCSSERGTVTWHD